jgi:hypothetical protein
VGTVLQNPDISFKGKVGDLPYRARLTEEMGCHHGSGLIIEFRLEMLRPRIESFGIDLTENRFVAEHLGYHGNHRESKDRENDLLPLLQRQGLQGKLKCRSACKGAKDRGAPQPFAESPLELLDRRSFLYGVAGNALDQGLKCPRREIHATSRYGANECHGTVLLLGEPMLSAIGSVNSAL